MIKSYIERLVASVTDRKLNVIVDEDIITIADENYLTAIQFSIDEKIETIAKTIELFART